MSKSLTAEQQKYIQKNFKIPVDNRFPQTFWIISLDGVSPSMNSFYSPEGRIGQCHTRKGVGVD